MKVLIVHSCKNDVTSPYIEEQVNSLIAKGMTVDFFDIKKPGIRGYLSYVRDYYSKIRSYQPDIVHAHYGLSGLFANFQRKVPVITSFHGSDVYIKKNWVFSKLASLLSKESIFVSSKLKMRLNTRKGFVITCGVDFDRFFPAEKLIVEPEYALFSGAFNNHVKNYPLAKSSIDEYNSSNNTNIELIELVDLTRDEVANLMRNARFLLITSTYEGSSQVLKEAMASNCPVISTDVGSVSELLEKNSGIIVGNDNFSICEAILEVMSNAKNYSKGRLELAKKGISLDETATKIIDLYKKTIMK